MSPDDRPVVYIEALSKKSRRLWEQILEIASALGEETRWALVGGLMVQLHAFEHQGDARLTDDIDVLGDSRRRPSMTKEIAELLERRGGQMTTPSSSSPDLGYQFDLDGQIVEVLGPDGVKKIQRRLAGTRLSRFPEELRP